MCIIIAKPAGVEPIKPEYFENAWEHNSHGGGVVFKEKGKEVTFKKGFMDKKEFLDYLEKLNQKDTSFIAHFRIKSVGEIKPENCHPFVLKNVTFAHNGTLHITPLEGKTDSETFGQYVFKNHTLNWIKENQFVIEMALDHSKFAVMDNKTGEIFVLNKQYGEERDGAWYSNSSAFPVVQTQTNGYYKGTTYIGGGVSNYDSDFWDSPVCKYKPIKTFGTKQHKEPGAHFSKEFKCWINDYDNKKRSPRWCDGKIVTNLKGFLVLDKTVIPDAKFETRQYKPNDEIIRLMQDEQLLINKALDVYRNSTFDSYADREDDEMEIKYRYFVLNGIRRLISAKKAVTAESLYGYIYGNVQKESPIMTEYMTQQFANFDSSVCDIIEEWVVQLGLFEDDEKAQPADKVSAVA